MSETDPPPSGDAPRERGGPPEPGAGPSGRQAALALALKLVLAALRREGRGPGRGDERQMFEPYASRAMSDRQRRIYAAYELAYTLVDFSAAFSFVVGSVLFLSPERQTVGTWFFIVGSLLFATKPSLRLARELHRLGTGRSEEVAKRAEG